MTWSARARGPVHPDPSGTWPPSSKSPATEDPKSDTLLTLSASNRTLNDVVNQLAYAQLATSIVLRNLAPHITTVPSVAWSVTS